MKRQRILAAYPAVVIALSGALTVRAQQDGTASIQALRDELALANRILANEGVLDG